MTTDRSYEQVLVPVPEELVGDVLGYLRWGSTGLPTQDWDQSAVGQRIAELDEVARRLVLHVAACAVEGVIVSIADASKVAGCSQREVLGLVLELNDSLRSAGGLPLVLATSMLHETTATGPDAWSVNMPRDIAAFVLAAAGIEPTGSPRPG